MVNRRYACDIGYKEHIFFFMQDSATASHASQDSNAGAVASSSVLDVASSSVLDGRTFSWVAVLRLLQ